MQIGKRKSMKIMIVIFLICALIVPLGIRACDNNDNYSNTSMEANKYTMNVNVDKNGNMNVAETIVIDNYTDYYNNYFYKEIAYNKNNMFGNSSINKASLEKNVSLLVEDKTGVVFDSNSSINNYPKHFVGFSYENDKDERGYTIKCETRSASNCDMIFYYNKPGMARFTTFTYEYTINGAITQYNDVSEFNWVLLDYQPFKFSDITINITLPDGNYNIKDMNTFFHGTNKANIKFVGNNKIVIEANDMISDEQIEVRLLLDNNIFTGINNVNRVNINALSDILEFEEEQEKNADIKFMVGNVLAIGVFIFIALFYLIFTIICYRKYDKEFESEFYNEYYRELPASYPPAVMGYLYKFREIDDNDLTATLLDLIRRKYLILDTNSNSVNEKNPNYTILLNKEKSQNNLTNSERFLIKWFINEIGDGTKVSSLQLNSYCDELWGAQQYRESSKQWYKLVKVEAKKYNFFDENIHKPKKFFVIFSILIGALAFFSLWFISSYSKYSLGIHLSFGILFLTLAFITYVNSFDRRSKSGNEDYVRWRAFNKFLEDFSSFEDYPVPSLIIWEHYLVYATSFGIADKVMEQLKLKLDLSYVNTFDSTFVIYFGFNHRIGGFNHMVRGMRSSAMSTITKRNAQRGGGFSSGGGGGFSGGSSFGGGGGSFGGGRR